MDFIETTICNGKFNWWQLDCRTIQLYAWYNSFLTCFELYWHILSSLMFLSICLKLFKPNSATAAMQFLLFLLWLSSIVGGSWNYKLSKPQLLDFLRLRSTLQNWKPLEKTASHYILVDLGTIWGQPVTGFGWKPSSDRKRVRCRLFQDLSPLVLY